MVDHVSTGLAYRYAAISLLWNCGSGSEIWWPEAQRIQFSLHRRFSLWLLMFRGQKPVRAAPPGTSSTTEERARRRWLLLEEYRRIFITVRDECLPRRRPWTQGQRRSTLLCRLELPRTGKCTGQRNATHAHLASLTGAADGSTAGRPLPSEIWSLVTEGQGCADSILAKLPSNSQEMVIRNDSRTCWCPTNKCPASQHLVGWALCLAGSEPTYVWIGSLHTQQVPVSCKAVGLPKQFAKCHSAVPVLWVKWDWDSDRGMK